MLNFTICFLMLIVGKERTSIPEVVSYDVEITREKITDPLEIWETIKYSNGKEITTLEKYWPRQTVGEIAQSKIKENLPEKKLWSEDGTWSLISYYAFPRLDGRGYVLIKRGTGYESSDHYYEVSMYIEGKCKFSIDPNKEVTKGNPYSFYWSKDTNHFVISGDYGFYEGYYDGETPEPPTLFFFDINKGTSVKEVCSDSASEAYKAYHEDSLIRIEFE
jgi:hypothetical protein